MTSHRTHNHPATPAARAACRAAEREIRNRAVAFVEKASSVGMGSYVIRTAVRIDAITQEQAFGSWGYNASGEWVKDTSGVIPQLEAMIAIYRMDPGFSWSQFSHMHS